MKAKVYRVAICRRVTRTKSGRWISGGEFFYTAAASKTKAIAFMRKITGLTDPGVIFRAELLKAPPEHAASIRVSHFRRAR